MDPLKLSKEQQDFVSKSLEYADKLETVWQRKARIASLPLLADFLKESANIIRKGIELQCRALRDSTLTKQTEKVAIEGKHTSLNCRCDCDKCKDGKCADCLKDRATEQNKALVDTLQRRGLFD